MASALRKFASRARPTGAYLFAALVAVLTALVLGARYAPTDAARLDIPNGRGQVAVGGGNPPAACPGDCDGDGQVTVDEILRIVDIVLGTLPLASCPALSAPPDIRDLVRAINSALTGCPRTPTPTATPIPTDTPIPTPTPFVFELGEGSQIVYSVPPTPPIAEPLSGSMAIAFGEEIVQFWIYDITSLEFHSPGFAITPQSLGDAGDIRVPLTCPASPITTFRVLINGEPWALSSLSGEIPTCPPDLSTIKSFEVCNPIGDPQFCPAVRAGTQAGYSITVVPVRKR